MTHKKYPEVLSESSGFAAVDPEFVQTGENRLRSK